MLRRTFIAGLLASLLPLAPANAQNPAKLSRTLSRLGQNPRYRGRVLGTHIRRQGQKVIYEVRILRPNDRVILVFIDPKTGRILGDSGGN